MSRLEKLIRELCPDGVDSIELSDICDIIAGGDVPKERFSEKKTAHYLIPIISNGIGKNAIYGYTDTPRITVPAVTIAARGTIGYCELRTEPFYPIIRLICVIPHNGIVPGFLKLAIEKIKFQVPKTGIPQLTVPMVRKYKIPVPPLEVQQEIVRMLDSFTALTTELQTELQARRKQFEYYRDKLLTFGDNVPQIVLGDVCTVTKLAGFEFTKYVTYSSEGSIIALRGLNVKNGALDLSDVKYIDGSDLSKLSRSKLHIGDMLFTYVGTIGQVALINEENRFYLAPNVALIRADKNVLLPEYMRYYFQSNQFWKTQINRLLQASSMKNIPMEKIRKFVIPIPSLEEQQRIVSILDRFDTLCNDLSSGLPAEIEARQKQYEYYRDKLLTFKEKA